MDLPALLDLQEPGAVAGLSDVFPQESHPFPRDAVLARWRVELADPGVAAYVAHDGSRLLGFAARRGDEVLHFGTALQSWGSGIASWLLEELLATFDPEVRRIRLWVFTDNGRGRRFWEKHGWQPTGRTTRSTFAPYPTLLEYARSRTGDESAPADGSR
ncbi:MAG TPA: GNAT family N-acetyltransferase [Nocardioides sp.]|uniref:GNAT family N-acetyltransferase n=1 Tax=Nocardioides sp. TaxID=35761 RepID=UPI002E32140A|nr:GNAT family N-acetyltransferase [Nocardioides sp.]HEX5089706.1 GNAT family N-acetyltransferase [Nocardioides sp.]